MNLLEDQNIIERLLMLLNAQSSSSSATPATDDPYNALALQLKSFIDEIPGGFLIYQADGDERIIYANSALLRIFKCESFAEFMALTGSSFKGMVLSEDFDRTEKSIRDQVSHSRDALDYVEYRIKDREGNVRWIEDYGHFVKTQSYGNIFYVFISDATEKIIKRFLEQAELKKEKDESEKKLHDTIIEYNKELKIINNAHLRRMRVIEGLSVNYESIAYVDLDSDEIVPYRLSTRFTKLFKEILDVRKFSEFLVEYIDMWVHPEDKDKINEQLSSAYIKKLLTEQKTYYMNYRVIENGETRYLQLRLANVSQDDNASHAVMGFRLIDEELLKEMQQRKLLKEALDTANRAAKAQNIFLSNMSHDLRTPLNAIFGYTALAKHSTQDQDGMLEYINKIEHSCNQMLELVNMVLEFSNAETSELKINESGCNVCSIVNKVCDGVSDVAAKNGVTVYKHTKEITHKKVITDDEKLAQLLSHIVNNAVKYNKTGGKVDITVQELPNTVADFSLYKFIVQDTGIGIEKSFLKRIFVPFERQNNTTKSGILGVGLGLTVVKHIVDAMGGNIDVKSEVGVGTTVTVTLGLKVSDDEGDSSAEIDEEELSELFKGKKILLVDDNEINIEIESELLQDYGLEVDIAENGAIAVEKVAASAQGEYLFVLMDIQMPVMDGRQATIAIRNLPDPVLANIPVIALSANAFEHDKLISIEAGLDDHLTKPLDVVQMIKKIGAILKSRQKK